MTPMPKPGGINTLSRIPTGTPTQSRSHAAATGLPSSSTTTPTGDMNSSSVDLPRLLAQSRTIAASASTSYSRTLQIAASVIINIEIQNQRRDIQRQRVLLPHREIHRGFVPRLQDHVPLSGEQRCGVSHGNKRRHALPWQR